MRRLIPVSTLSALLFLGACDEDRSPSGPEPSVSATAGQKVVTSLADPGDGRCTPANCTLREAINDPTSTGITFASNLSGTITLARPEVGGGILVITKSLTITGPAAGLVIRRLSTAPVFRVMRIDSGVTVSLANLTIRGSGAVGPAGAILARGTLRLSNCRIVGNATSGISAFAPLILVSSTIADNAGGGIWSQKKPVTLTGSAVRRNGGGGIVGGGTVTIDNSAVTDNAGVGVSTGGVLAMTRSEVVGNGRGGVSLNWGTATLERVKILRNLIGPGVSMHKSAVTLTNSTIARNAGGGVTNSVGQLSVTASTVANNTGDGIRNESFSRSGVRMSMINSTVSGNAGNGIYFEDDVEASAHVDLTNTTVAFNAGHGIEEHGMNGATLDLTNTIVAKNGAAAAPDIYASGDGALVGASFSLIGDGNGSGLTNDGGNQVGNVSPNSSPIDPLLAPLTNNGGPTPTHALLLGSPAIDAGGNDVCMAVDQRGVPRPQGPTCDIGSFEATR